MYALTHQSASNIFQYSNLETRYIMQGHHTHTYYSSRHANPNNHNMQHSQNRKANCHMLAKTSNPGEDTVMPKS